MQLTLTTPPAQTRGIKTREQFCENIAAVNALVKREDISVPEAKDCLTKAEALKAWAQFDKRLTAEEKAEANRTMARTIAMLVELAEREQPRVHLGGRRGSAPGPTAWLARELGWNKSRTDRARALVNMLPSVLQSGKHWVTVVRGYYKDNPRNSKPDVLRGSVRALNSAFSRGGSTVGELSALNVQELAHALVSVRSAQAHLKAFEDMIVSRQNALRKSSGEVHK